jgi:membrane associated rhomboid family serine protease
MRISETRRLGLVRLAAWILVALIVAITLVPIGLRPVVTANPSIERIAAYALAGLLMMMGYRRHWPWILIGSVLLAGGLEAAQTLTSTRHGRIDDFLVKAAAALAGAGAGFALASLVARPQAAERRKGAGRA